MARLKKYYNEKIVQALTKQFNYTNSMEVPKLEKIVLNMGVGEATLDKKKIDTAIQELALITGQKPVICLAKKAIAAFKLRENIPIGCKVTLRADKMYEFLDRLITIALPRVRDFRALPINKGFDNYGNYSMGLKEQIVFPEINYDKIDKIRGMDITICTTAKTNAEARSLLIAFNMPFVKEVVKEGLKENLKPSAIKQDMQQENK